MSYQILCDGYVLHDSRSEVLKVVEPMCELELNKTGTLSFKIAPTHPYYNVIKKLKSEISLYQDGDWLFSGRVLNDEIDFKNFKNVEVEGILGYLLDSVQRVEIHHITDDGDKNKIQVYLEKVIGYHNEQVDESKRFIVRNVGVKDTSPQLYKISSYEDTLTTLNKDLIDTFNGYLIPVVENGVKYLEYKNASDFETNEQIILFGKNLIDLNQYIKGESIATVVIPLGGTVDSEETDEGDTVDTKLNLIEVDDFTDGTLVHKKGTDFIYDTEAVEKYGWIYKVVTFDGITEDINDLVNKGKEQLNYYKLQELSLELTAFDLHLLDVEYDAIRLGQKIRVKSLPHNLDEMLIVSKIDINVARPDKTVITLTSETRTAKEINSIAKKTNDNNTNVSIIENEVKNSDYATNKDLEKYVSNNDFNTKFDDYINNGAIDNKFDDYVDNGNFKKTFDDYTKGNDFNKSMKDYMSTNDFKNNMTSAGYAPTTGTSGEQTVDLSSYATKQEVEDAFDELATLLGGV